jgi:large subunit ribosomal protein L23
MQLHNVILRALITEKSTKEGEKGKFTFLVSPKADKKTIRHAFQQVFKVDVVNVVTLRMKGGRKKTGTRRIEVKESPVKKAIVTIKEGQTLGGVAKTETEKKESKKKESEK